MSRKVATVVPENCRVSKSTGAAHVILTIEVRVEGEGRGAPGGEQRYLLAPFEAIALGRQLQDQSIQLLLSLAGYEAPTGRFPETDESLQ